MSEFELLEFRDVLRKGRAAMVECQDSFLLKIPVAFRNAFEGTEKVIDLIRSAMVCAALF